MVMHVSTQFMEDHARAGEPDMFGWSGAAEEPSSVEELAQRQRIAERKTKPQPQDHNIPGEQLL